MVCSLFNTEGNSQPGSVLTALLTCMFLLFMMASKNVLALFASPVQSFKASHSVLTLLD